MFAFGLFLLMWLFYYVSRRLTQRRNLPDEIDLRGSYAKDKYFEPTPTSLVPLNKRKSKVNGNVSGVSPGAARKHVEFSPSTIGGVEKELIESGTQPHTLIQTTAALDSKPYYLRSFRVLHSSMEDLPGGR